jgi:hypothetical protein
MNGFAGFVNYKQDFLFDIPNVTDCLWKMAGALGAGCGNGIDVLENNGAFVWNSVIPIHGKNYCFKTKDDVCYFFYKGCLNMPDGPHCGAFFMPRGKRLCLFSNKEGLPVYYNLCEEKGLTFGTVPQAIHCCKIQSKQKTLEPGYMIEYDMKGLSIRLL